MDGLCEKFLASAAFTIYEHSVLRLYHLFCGLHCILHFFGAKNNVLEMMFCDMTLFMVRLFT